MKILAAYGREELATVWVLELGSGRTVECVESTQPPLSLQEKWVLIVSVSSGCPVRCPICDAGGYFTGHLSRAEILEQVDFMVTRRCPDRHIAVPKFKIQFARMGEPAYNDAVIDTLRTLPQHYDAPGLMPCVSTIAPSTGEEFLERLLEVKNAHYSGGRFQMQFSIHTTDDKLRDRLIPARKWSLATIGRFGERFFTAGDRKITLNFATPEKFPVDAARIKDLFDPSRFLLKFTPVNPTYRARSAGLGSFIDAHDQAQRYETIDQLRALGFEVLVSIGENEENLIGSNCGQFILHYLKNGGRLDESYLLEEYQLAGPPAAEPQDHRTCPRS